MADKFTHAERMEDAAKNAIIQMDVKGRQDIQIRRTSRGIVVRLIGAPMPEEALGSLKTSDS
jgi:hypothetical protein